MEVTINDKFWYEDPDILFSEDRLIEFIPLSDHTPEEWLNATVRFSTYASVLFYIFKREWIMFMLPFITMCMTYYFYYRNKEYYDINDDDHFPCARPSKDNPLMNILVSDLGYNQNRKKACDVNHVKKDIQKYFNRNRYRNAFDILEGEAIERQFYTNPVTTIPNKQDDFANWLYNEKKDTCKTNIGNCEVDEDIRKERDNVTSTWYNHF